MISTGSLQPRRIPDSLYNIQNINCFWLTFSKHATFDAYKKKFLKTNNSSKITANFTWIGLVMFWDCHGNLFSLIQKGSYIFYVFFLKCLSLSKYMEWNDRSDTIFFLFQRFQEKEKKKNGRRKEKKKERSVCQLYSHHYLDLKGNSIINWQRHLGSFHPRQAYILPHTIALILSAEAFSQQFFNLI